MAIQDITKPMALDETLQATNQALGGVAKDTSLQATNTALGLLGKDATLQSIVTALASIGLNTVGNLAQLTTEQKTSLVAAINELMAGKVPNSAIGVANGVAELDANGLVPSSQIPDAVDEIIEGYLYNGTFYEDSAHTKPITGKTGKIYVDLSTEKTYRWGGSAYVEISASLALGETSSTAYRGDRGKTAYDHSQDASRVTSATVEGLYKIGATAQGHISSLSAVQKSDITSLGIPGQDTTYSDATQSVHGLMSANDKTKLDGISTGANKVEDSSTNGNIKIDNEETQVYDDSDIQAKLSTALTPISGNPISISGLKSTQLAVEPVITFEPIQDLHGQDKPYPAGGGKNLLPMTVDGIKALNTSGTWLGNVFTPTGQNITFTILVDDANNVIGIKANGTVSANITFVVAHDFNGHGDILLSGNPATSSDSTFIEAIFVAGGSAFGGRLKSIYNSGDVSGNFDTETRDIFWGIGIANGYTANNLVFTPMIRLATVSDASFAPYSNICPISGYNKIEVLSCGVNVWDEQWESGSFDNQGNPVANQYTIRTKNYIPVIADTTYHWVSPAYNGNGFYFFDKAKIFISAQWYNANSDIRTPAGTAYVKFDCYVSTYSNNISLNYPSTDTQYHPYVKTTDLSESLGQTVYGGTLDVRTGKLEVIDTPQLMDLGSLNWSLSGSHLFYIDNAIANIKGSGSNGVPANMICECFSVTSYSAIWSRSPVNNTIALQGNGTRLSVYCESYSDATAFKTAMSGKYLCYELKDVNKFTIQLTPHEISLLEQYAYVSTNGTTIALSYHNGEMASLGDVEELYKTVERDIVRSQHAYSTTEQVVGTWTDGKPIYEKTWEFDSYIIISTNDITSLASKGVVLSDVDYFVNAVLISKVDKRVCNTFTVGYFSGNIGVYNATNADEAIDKVILQYTKTTD